MNRGGSGRGSTLAGRGRGRGTLARPQLSLDQTLDAQTSRGYKSRLNATNEQTGFSVGTVSGKRQQDSNDRLERQGDIAKKAMPIRQVKKIFKQNQTTGNGNLDRVIGSLMSPEDIKRLGSACDLTTLGKDKSCLENPRMGPTEHDQECATCGFKVGKCNGHWGMMTIPPGSEFAHPWYIDEGIIPAIMNLFCFTCFKRDLERYRRNALDPSQDFIPAAVMKFDRLTVKTMEDQLANFNPIDKLKELSTRAQKRACPVGDAATHFRNQPDKKSHDFYIVEVIGNKKEDNADPVDIRIMRLYLTAISNFIEVNNLEDFFGFGKMRYEDMIISIIPVLPTCNRPTMVVAGRKQDNDINTLYWKMLEIIRKIREFAGDEVAVMEYRKELRQTFFGYINSKNMPTTVGRGGDPLKTLTQIFDGKRGLFRNNILSGRVDNSGRTVVSGDNSIRPDQARIPMFMAEKFLIRLDITAENMHLGNQLIESGIAKVYIENPNGATRNVVPITDKNRESLLAAGAKIGSRIYRRLITGDVVTINRQPTLHKWSFMAMKAVVMDKAFNEKDVNTIGMNTAYVGGFNMDFDGDEVHIHVPGSIDARAEAAALMSVELSPISDQTSVNIFTLIQNSVWGAYEMTKPVRIFDKVEYQRLAAHAIDYDDADFDPELDDDGENNSGQTNGGNNEEAEDNFDIVSDHVKNIKGQVKAIKDMRTERTSGFHLLSTKRADGTIIQKGRYQHVMDTAPLMFHKYGVRNLGLYNSYTLLSLAFPEDFSYRNSSDKENPVIVERGILVSGILSKTTVGSAPGSIIQVMFESHGPKAIVIFTHVMQQLVNAWMTTVGLTISITDFAPEEDVEEKLEAVKSENLRRAEEIAQRNVEGVFDIDKLAATIDELINPEMKEGDGDNVATNENTGLGYSVYGRLKSELCFKLFKVMMVELNSYKKRGNEQLFNQTVIALTVKRVITDVVEGDSEVRIALRQTLYDELLTGIIDFLVENVNDPFDTEVITVKDHFEKTKMEADSLDALEAIRGKLSEIVLSKEEKARGGPLMAMINSKARGNEFNLIQAKAGVGQQTKSNARLKQAISGDTRVFPFFMENDPDPEARGYVRNSLFRGMTPVEYYSASMPARESQTDTSLNTGKTGYMQRKLQAACGDFRIFPDGTVRNEKGEIITFSYGTGLDPSRMIKKGGEFYFVDVEQLVRETNSYFEAPIRVRKEYYWKI